MPVERATLEDAAAEGIDLGSNAFLLVHGWTAGPLLLEFVAKAKGPLAEQPRTSAALAQALGVEEGPLAILLRTCSVLGYVAFDPASDAYSVVPGPELDELEAHLGPGAATAERLRGLYTDAVPPFKVPSEPFSKCLAVWEEQRPSWKNSKSKALPILLDGIVLAPLLTSITYFDRWNEEGLDQGKDNSMDSFDFSKLDAGPRATLSSIFQELGVGSLGAGGVLKLSSKGSLAMQRCYSYYVPTSYSPLLAHFSHVLVEDAGWGFVDAGQDTSETEVHVKRTLNVVGSGAQHQTLFKDLMHHVDAVFGGEDFEAQPKFVADTGCGDGHLLQHIYEHVKRNTPRGQNLDAHPLTMIGIDFNEESRMATAINLSKHDVPHMVLKGDIGKPAEIVSALKKLKKKKVDPAKTLHVRSFLDHDRPYIPPAKAPADDSVTAAYARAQMADFVHLDKHGKPIRALEVFASLVEHLERWAQVLEGSFGLCMLEVMMLDVPTTRRFFNDCVSFHFDVVQCLSRQYMISPAAFAMAGAMAGLLPASFEGVQTYPEQGRYCRVLNQHLVRRPYRIRFAELSDLPDLQRLEELVWALQLRAPEAVLRRRLEASPATNLVVELAGKVVAALYMQRIPGLEAVDAERFMEISAAHAPEGRVLQLVAIVADPDPEVLALGLGSQLRAFALHLARLDPGVDCVVGVTRCSAFAGKGCPLQEYVDKHVAGELADPTVGFHTGYGAKVLRLVPGFRPEDTDNEGVGVLIQYNVKDWVAKRRARPSAKRQAAGGAAAAAQGEAAAAAPAEAPSLELLSGILGDLGYEVDLGDLGMGFLNYGMDSLELNRIRTRLGSLLGLEFPPTLLLDFPNVQELARELDRHRGMGDFKAAEPEAPKSAWDSITAEELLFIQDKCNKFYALPQFQNRLQEAKQKCPADRAKYLKAIEPILVEVEGPIFLANDVISDTKLPTVQQAREDMAKCVARLSKDKPEVRDRARELLRLTKQEE